MSLFSQTQGQGPSLVLLHGWGMNGDVWEGVLPQLAERFTVTAIDLPGHGRSPRAADGFTLPQLAAQLAAQIPGGSHVLGWSLGGLVASQLALDFPAHVQRLVLVASAPRFVRSVDWPDAVEAEVLGGFARELQTDFRNTIKRFLAIQALGSERAREEMRILRERVFRHGEPDPQALAAGLEILMRADLRARLGELKSPTLLLAGEYDSLFPPAAAERSRGLLPQARTEVIKGAGHAPFISHPEQFLAAVEDFLGHE